MPMILTIALLGAIALLVPALHSLLMSRRDLALAQTALVDRQLLESAAGDLVLSIEEDVAAYTARRDVEVTARDKAYRFIERGRCELPNSGTLTDAQLLALLQSTLPKLGLGAFADRRPRAGEFVTTAAHRG